MRWVLAALIVGCGASQSTPAPDAGRASNIAGAGAGSRGDVVQLADGRVIDVAGSGGSMGGSGAAGTAAPASGGTGAAALDAGGTLDVDGGRVDAGGVLDVDAGRIDSGAAVDADAGTDAGSEPPSCEGQSLLLLDRCADSCPGELYCDYDSTTCNADGCLRTSNCCALAPLDSNAAPRCRCP